MRVWTFCYETKKSPHQHFKANKTHCAWHFSVCSLNTKSFSHALMFIKSFMVNFVQLINGNGADRIFLFVMVRFDVNKDLIKWFLLFYVPPLKCWLWLRKTSLILIPMDFFKADCSNFPSITCSGWWIVELEN